jgi:hypothetical protein
MPQAFFRAESRRLDLERARGAAPVSRELFCPFEPDIHPHADAINSATVSWALATGLVDARTAPRLEASKVGSLLARAYPRGAREPLQLAADWTTFFCLLDDVIETIEAPAGVSRVLAEIAGVLCGASAARPERPLERAAQDLGARLDRHASPSQRARFQARVDELFEAFTLEAGVRHGARPLPVEAYLPLREITVGIHVEAALGEIVDGIDLAPDARAAIERSGLLRSASNLVGWANDVHTYEKELREGEVNNLVAVLAESDGLDLHEAVAQAIAMHDAEMRELAARRAEIEAVPGLAPYVLMCCRWVRGHLDWALETGRYRP